MLNTKIMYIYKNPTMIILFLNMIICKKATSQTSPSNDPGCFDGPSYLYNGSHSYTKSGIPCQRWDETTPHKPKFKPSDGGHHNYCRNPVNDLGGLWCYTSSQAKRWEQCKIPKCNNDSRIMWTDYDKINQSTQIISLHADPEVVSEIARYGEFNLTVLELANKAEYWAITGDYVNQMVFYTDYRSEYLGILNLLNNTSIRAFEGMAHGIESLAHDPVTGNLYWTDAVFKWIMVVEKNLRYYTPIYRMVDGSPYALTLHAKLRKLYFSVFSETKASIIETDLAGNNQRVLYKYPDIRDVTSLTIDYVNDRLYWTDFTGQGSRVMSCKLNGTDRKQHFYKKTAIFWGVAVYQDYLYVTDINKKSKNHEQFYVMWILAKQRKKAFRYRLNGRPRHITVLSASELPSLDTVDKQGGCNNNSANACEQICIPMGSNTRKCACALGYQKVGETRCRAEIFSDEYILVADEAQGRLYQIPLSYSNKSPLNYSIIITPGENTRISTVASDTTSGYIYWSDKQYYSIKRSLINGSNEQTLASNNHASSIVVDPCSKNIFFLDAEQQTIYLMSSKEGFMKALMKTDLSKYNNSNIQMLELDVRSKKVYWTNTLNQIGKGEVWRMNYDGTNVELVYENLNWPRAITIDREQQRLFISEAKTAMVYSVSLSSIINITNTSPSSIDQQYDLSGQIEKVKYFITDIKVHDGILYFMDDKNQRLQKINLTEGPASMSMFGPPDFYKVVSISLFSRKNSAYIGCQPSPCSSRLVACQQLCVDLSDSDSRCLCKDGMYPAGVKQTQCLKGNKTNNPPTAGNTCPNDMTLTVSACSDYVIPNWKPPTWSDDETDSASLIIKSPSISQKLVVGRHFFSYSATDQHKETGVCEFSVTVVGPTCGKPPTLPDDMQAKPISDCGDRYGSTYVVTCKDSKKSIHQNGLVSKNLTNLCDSTGLWTPFSNFTEAYCKEDSTKTTESSPVDFKNATAKEYSSTAVDKNKITRISTSKPMAVGLILAICLLVIIIVILIAGLAYKKTRRRSIPWLNRVNFPMFWKRKDDNSKTTSLESFPTRVTNLLETERRQYCRNPEPARCALLHNHVKCNSHGADLIIEHHISKCDSFHSHITMHYH